MSGYLDGDDAFDKVLDRLVESERRNATAESQNSDRYSAIQQAECDLRAANQRISEIESAGRAGQPKLKALWDAAKAVSDVLNSDSALLKHDQVHELTCALALASVPCGGDDIPF